MQLAYGFLTRYVARPALLAGGQLIFGPGLLVGGLAQSIGQLLGAISVARIGASPQHPVGNALLSDAYPAERRGFAISAHISGGNVGTRARAVRRRRAAGDHRLAGDPRPVRRSRRWSSAS